MKRLGSPSGRLLIHVLGGPALVAPLLQPPAEVPTVHAWACGRQEIHQDRLEQLAKLQKGRRP